MIHLNSILHEIDIVYCLPESLGADEIPSTVYTLSKTIRNEIVNYKNIANSIFTNDTRTHGTALISCNCANSKCLNDHHGPVISGHLQIIENKKLCKIISKGPNYREPKTINWKKSK